MNKAFKIINSIMFLIIVIILFSFYTHIFDFSFVKIALCSFVVLILLIMNIIQFKRKNKILNDKKYNIMFFLVNTIVLIIYLRDKFDPLIPLGSVTDIADKYSPSSSGAFFDYNIILIMVMYVGIIIYNLLNKDKTKKI